MRDLLNTNEDTRTQQNDWAKSSNLSQARSSRRSRRRAVSKKCWRERRIQSSRFIICNTRAAPKAFGVGREFNSRPGTPPTPSALKGRARDLFSGRELQ